MTATSTTAEIALPQPGAPETSADGHEDRLLDHTYDGIHEYDNPMPGWWKMIFAATIAFSAAYGYYYHFSTRGRNPHQQYEASLTDYRARRTYSGGGGGGAAVAASEETLARDVSSDVVLEYGKRVFLSRCAGCHGEDGSGKVGPNLTDGFQIHGSSRMDIFNVVSGGVPNTAMVAWSEQLSGAEVHGAAVYAISLRGSNRAGKAPDGKPVTPFSAAAK